MNSSNDRCVASAYVGFAQHMSLQKKQKYIPSTEINVIDRSEGKVLVSLSKVCTWQRLEKSAYERIVSSGVCRRRRKRRNGYDLSAFSPLH